MGILVIRDKQKKWYYNTNYYYIEENAIIDEVIFVFKEQVKDMVGGKKTSFGKLL